MPHSMHTWRHLSRFWAGLLVLAVLWLTLWGQLHRTLHPAELGQQTEPEVFAALHLGHDEGTGLCHLLDHLSDGSGPLTLPWLPLFSAAPTPWLVASSQRLALAQPRLCDARAPPLS
mgnify:CR=1 FL=1